MKNGFLSNLVRLHPPSSSSQLRWEPSISQIYGPLSTDPVCVCLCSPFFNSSPFQRPTMARWCLRLSAMKNGFPECRERVAPKCSPGRRYIPTSHLAISQLRPQCLASKIKSPNPNITIYWIVYLLPFPATVLYCNVEFCTLPLPKHKSSNHQKDTLFCDCFPYFLYNSVPGLVTFSINLGEFYSGLQ